MFCSRRQLQNTVCCSRLLDWQMFVSSFCMQCVTTSSKFTFNCYTDCHKCCCLQIVVLAGGTNDFRSTTPPLEEWTNDVISFLDMVSTASCVCYHVGSSSVVCENAGSLFWQQATAAVAVAESTSSVMCTFLSRWRAQQSTAWALHSWLQSGLCLIVELLS